MLSVFTGKNSQTLEKIKSIIFLHIFTWILEGALFVPYLKNLFGQVVESVTFNATLLLEC
jgi:hypothetical protein